jgi:hypothetical protein
MTPGRGPGNGEAAGQAHGGGDPRPPRQYRPGRGRHVENTIMSALVRAGLVPRSYLLTPKAARPAGRAPTPWSRWTTAGGAGWSPPTGRCLGYATPARLGG